MQREYDIILYGASGFTGRLVAAYLLERYGMEGELRWAIAGRNAQKLAAIAAELGAPTLPLVVADSGDPTALQSLAESTRVVCTTVGPYALYGSELVAACVAAGSDYCDLTGEVQWMRAMIDRHQAAAQATGARIVHCCGFDSIPSDLGTLFLQEAMLARHGVPARQVKLRVNRIRGGASGGTIASIINMLEQAGRDRQVRRILADPYALLPDGSPRGQDRGDQLGAVYDSDFDRWTLPFIMAAINTRVVRRSNALLDYPWGEDFRYDEAVLASARRGAVGARLSALGMSAGTFSLAVPPLRAVAKRLLPKPGEGPDRAARESGSFDLYLYGVHPRDRGADMIARVTGDRDPGYGSTSKMLAEAAVCLASDEPCAGGGFWTPASALGQPLTRRLQANAGLSFTLEESTP